MSSTRVEQHEIYLTSIEIQSDESGDDEDDMWGLNNNGDCSWHRIVGAQEPALFVLCIFFVRDF